jgi:hypothetical protein
MRRPLGTVAAATLALFFAIAALLVFQLRSGRDPALGSGTPVAAATVSKPKRVLVRKVIITRVVHDAPRAAAPAPVQRTSTTPAAPAAPAPAPAPAPLTTQSS